MIATNETNSAAAASSDEARSIVTSRLFDAPRELVWDVWTDPHHVSQWWGPHGFTTTTSEMNLRPGGVWRFVMHGPDGVDYKNRVVFREVVRPERLAYAHGGEEEYDDIQFEVTVTFDDEGGKTRVTLHSVFPTAEARDFVVREHGAIEGAKQTLERLGAQLSTMLVIERTFDAPRDLVWAAWTEREHLLQWWGPKGFEVFSCTQDLRPGGIMHYGLRNDGGMTMWGRWVYREVTPPERLVFVSSFSNEEGGMTRSFFSDDWPLETLTTVRFAENDGKTTITMYGIPINAPESEHRLFESYHPSMQGGWGGTFDQLAEYLKRA